MKMVEFVMALVGCGIRGTIMLGEIKVIQVGVAVACAWSVQSYGKTRIMQSIKMTPVLKNAGSDYTTKASNDYGLRHSLRMAINVPVVGKLM
jgi:hypothetical protein